MFGDRYIQSAGRLAGSIFPDPHKPSATGSVDEIRRRPNRQLLCLRLSVSHTARRETVRPSEEASGSVGPCKLGKVPVARLKIWHYFLELTRETKSDVPSGGRARLSSAPGAFPSEQCCRSCLAWTTRTTPAKRPQNIMELQRR
jgi:hypothetical protein